MARICFDDDGSTLDVEPGDALVDICDDHSTPLAFSCRNAMCGTCLISIAGAADALSPTEPMEAELLALLAPDNASARLACQVRVLGDVRVRALI